MQILLALVFCFELERLTRQISIGDNNANSDFFWCGYLRVAVLIDVHIPRPFLHTRRVSANLPSIRLRHLES